MQKKYCGYCGAENASEYLYCTNCGKLLSKTSTNTVNTLGEKDVSLNRFVPVTNNNEMSDEQFFIRDNIDIYLKKFDKLSRGSVISLNWGAFFFGSFWFLYRKMYLVGGLMLALQLLLSKWFFIIELVCSVFALFAADIMYSKYVKQHIFLAQNMEREEKQRYFKKKGQTGLAGPFWGMVATITYYGLKMLWLLWI